jgi:hypothetical protein
VDVAGSSTHVIARLGAQTELSDLSELRRGVHRDGKSRVMSMPSRGWRSDSSESLGESIRNTSIPICAVYNAIRNYVQYVLSLTFQGFPSKAKQLETRLDKIAYDRARIGGARLGW